MKFRTLLAALIGCTIAIGGVQAAGMLRYPKERLMKAASKLEDGTDVEENARILARELEEETDIEPEEFEDIVESMEEAVDSGYVDTDEEITALTKAAKKAEVVATLKAKEDLVFRKAKRKAEDLKVKLATERVERSAKKIAKGEDVPAHAGHIVYDLATSVDGQPVAIPTPIAVAGLAKFDKAIDAGHLTQSHEMEAMGEAIDAIEEVAPVEREASALRRKLDRHRVRHGIQKLRPAKKQSFFRRGKPVKVKPSRWQRMKKDLHKRPVRRGNMREHDFDY